MAIAKKLYFDVSWIDMCHDLSFEQIGMLMRNFMDYTAGLVVSDLSSVDSYLASCWVTMKDAIDVEKAHREAVSAARKVAGSLGGKKRALNFHRPDGVQKPVPVQSEGKGAEAQVPLYSDTVLSDSASARMGGVRVLPVVTKVPVKESVLTSQKSNVIQLSVFAKEFSNQCCQMLSAVNSSIQMLGSVVSSVSGASCQEIDLFGGPVSSPAAVSTPVMVVPHSDSVKSEVKDEKPKEEKPKKAKRSSRRTVYVDPPKSSSLIDESPRKRYGEFENVLLTDKQVAKLKQEFPDTWEDWIRRCDEYCELHHKEYDNYLMTIRNWARKDKEKGIDKPVLFSVNKNKTEDVYPADKLKPEEIPFYSEAEEKVHMEFVALDEEDRRRVKEMGRRMHVIAAQEGIDYDTADLDTQSRIAQLAIRQVRQDERDGKISFACDSVVHDSANGEV